MIGRFMGVSGRMLFPRQRYMDLIARDLILHPYPKAANWTQAILTGKQL